MTSQRKAFVAFQPVNGVYRPSMLLGDLLEADGIEFEDLLKQAAIMYGAAIEDMRMLVQQIEGSKKPRRPVSARSVWRLGNRIFRLTGDLDRLSLQMDDLYSHLVRDLGLKRKRLEKVVIFRRYLPEENMIPELLNWGKCEKGTKKVAQQLRENNSQWNNNAR